MASPQKTDRPLYHSVSEALREKLADGKLSTSAKLPSLRELATEFNVSTITVRQALRVLEDEGHLYRIPAVGTFVRSNLLARANTERIVVAYAAVEIEDGFTMEIVRGIEATCHERGWSLQVLNAQGDPRREALNLAGLPDAAVGGAIIMPTCHPDNHEVLFKLKIANFPLVLVDRSLPGLKVNLVESNHEQGAYLATRHLLEQGHSGVMLFTEQSRTTSIADRMRGHERALREHGIDDPWVWRLVFDPQAMDPETRHDRRWFPSFQAAMSVLKTAQFPLAIFAHNAYTAWGVVNACRKLGLRIPDDVSLACFDNTEIVQALSPPITAVAQRTVEIGVRAVDLLERRLAQDPDAEPEHIMVDVDLIPRESVCSPTPMSAAS